MTKPGHESPLFDNADPADMSSHADEAQVRVGEEVPKPELTKEQKEEFDRRDPNHPFTADGIRKDIGAGHSPDPNQAVSQIIGAEAAKTILGNIESNIEKANQGRVAKQREQKKESRDKLTELLRDPKT